MEGDMTIAHLQLHTFFHRFADEFVIKKEFLNPVLSLVDLVTSGRGNCALDDGGKLQAYIWMTISFTEGIQNSVARYNSDVRLSLVALHWSKGEAEEAEDLWQSTCQMDQAQVFPCLHTGHACESELKGTGSCCNLHMQGRLENKCQSSHDDVPGHLP